jgi:hypothetical protein
MTDVPVCNPKKKSVSQEKSVQRGNWIKQADPVRSPTSASRRLLRRVQ